jgi:hypothetical protein
LPGDGLPSFGLQARLLLVDHVFSLPEHAYQAGCKGILLQGSKMSCSLCQFAGNKVRTFAYQLQCRPAHC